MIWQFFKSITCRIDDARLWLVLNGIDLLLLDLGFDRFYTLSLLCHAILRTTDLRRVWIECGYSFCINCNESAVANNIAVISITYSIFLVSLRTKTCIYE